MTRAYNHYFKPVEGLTHIDVYRVLQLFGVTDPCIQHAVKKLLVAGGRGAKDIRKDVAEAIVSLKRWEEMREEETVKPLNMTSPAPIVGTRVEFYGCGVCHENVETPCGKADCPVPPNFGIQTISGKENFFFCEHCRMTVKEGCSAMGCPILPAGNGS